MTRVELEQLARRVETEEPSEELAAAVWRAAGRAVHFSTVYGHFFAGTNSDQPITDPLRSLDAAEALVPDGWFTADVYQFGSTPIGALHWRCYLSREETEHVKGTSTTEPRARTAAALRARAMEAGDD